ncbi:hypothetical protein CANARDRAFT_30005 [[Candida] arabinofermentans NRRL YB-2248]|uniref:Tafazzin family protein n=1 Tax=[Candida] arabinofermentans NRRL YB-2248 TaxID=983967 RepID=A0A1E4SV52_9ASCO|nr:hypothetical protein CANARDRAFT_30005 [[Candida] arabinofermentans NRRL YB-2248]
MSFHNVLKNGEDHLSESRPQQSKIWNALSHATCLLAVGGSKLILNLFYDVKVKGLSNIDAGLTKARSENRSFITLMNHMSVCDDPLLWGCLPWKYFRDVDDIRWGLAAANICFNNKFSSTFFSLGKILPCERFGRGPFQDSLDAAIRILSPDDTIDSEHIFQLENTVNPLINDIKSLYSKSHTPPVLRHKTSWMHIFPEGYVCQLEPPHNNSMRFFRWGTARLVLEPTVAPVIVPIFSNGFEKIAPEGRSADFSDSVLPQNIGAEISVNIGKPIDDSIIESFRKEWRDLCVKYTDATNPNDMSFDLKFGDEAKALRSRVCAYLREQVAKLRLDSGFPEEDPRFKSVDFWTNYTNSKGESDKDIKFVGLNWAVKEYQKNVKRFDEFGNEVKK